VFADGRINFQESLIENHKHLSIVNSRRSPNFPGYYWSISQRPRLCTMDGVNKDQGGNCSGNGSGRDKNGTRFHPARLTAPATGSYTHCVNISKHNVFGVARPCFPEIRRNTNFTPWNLQNGPTYALTAEVAETRIVRFQFRGEHEGGPPSVLLSREGSAI